MNFKYNERYRIIDYKHKNKIKTIWLTKIENKLFSVLKNGQVHTYSELINAMYDVEDNSFYLTNLRTNIMRLNKKIKDFGTIKAIRGVGYKLEVKDE